MLQLSDDIDGDIGAFRQTFLRETGDTAKAGEPLPEVLHSHVPEVTPASRARGDGSGDDDRRVPGDVTPPENPMAATSAAVRAFCYRKPTEKAPMNRDDALRQLNHLAHLRMVGCHVGSDRLIAAGLDALLAGIESPSLVALAGLLRKEEPEAPPLFEQVLEELGLLFQPPADPRAAKWAMAVWMARGIVDGSLDPALGTDLIHGEIADGLGHPEQLRELVSCAVSLADWTNDPWDTPYEELTREAVAAAERFLARHSTGDSEG
ncbi:hypothetical protein [Streptomyces sp. NPDC058953]|uniref:hypothetical protein n=1 Tax=unclassified Streptomyces TaxID=2593676 RepID=UPI0036C37981